MRGCGPILISSKPMSGNFSHRIRPHAQQQSAHGEKGRLRPGNRSGAAPLYVLLSAPAKSPLVVIVNAGLEHSLVHAAHGAAPVIGKILECSSGSDAMLRVALCGIIGIATGIAKIFFHSINLLSIAADSWSEAAD